MRRRDFIRGTVAGLLTAAVPKALLGGTVSVSIGYVTRIVVNAVDRFGETETIELRPMSDARGEFFVSDHAVHRIDRVEWSGEWTED